MAALDHLAWFVIDAVGDMDLSAFYADYRDEGHGRSAYEPSMMVALLLYAYATKQRSPQWSRVRRQQAPIALTPSRARSLKRPWRG